MNTNKIAWEKHPVSPERKAELIADGYKIIDVRFKPQSAQVEEKKPEPKKRVARKAQSKKAE